MIMMYFKIAWKNQISHGLTSLINLGGLTLGLAISIMMVIYSVHELSYDKFLKNNDRIFEFHINEKVGNNLIIFPNSSYVTGPLIKKSEPDVQEFMRIFDPKMEILISDPDKPSIVYNESRLLFADSNFFSFFSYPLIKGNNSLCLHDPFSLVISNSISRKYFGRQDPMGKVLKLKVNEEFYLYHITGVFDDPPSNSTLQFDMLSTNSSVNIISATSSSMESQHIEPGDFRTFILIRDPSKYNSISQSIKIAYASISGDDMQDCSLNKLTDLHLKSNYGDSPAGKYLKTFPLVAGLILLLALINYMSISTARATTRSKEVGIRKVVGASRFKIMLQFYIETALVTTPAFLIAYFLCLFITPLFFNKLNIYIDSSFILHSDIVGLLILLLLCAIFIAGSYPAIVLSSFNPILTIKVKLKKNKHGSLIREIFTIIQFSISVVLIICGLIIEKQLYYLRHSETGLDRNNIVLIKIHNNLKYNYESLRYELQRLSGIMGTATSNYPLYTKYDMFMHQGKGQSEDISLPLLMVDKNFIPLLNINWKNTIAFDSSPNDSFKIVLNETALTRIFPSVGDRAGYYLDNGSNKYQISGIVKDFSFSSMEFKIKPLAMLIYSDSIAHWGHTGCCMYLKITATNFSSTLESIEKTFRKYDTENPFEFTFLDDNFNAQYKAEDQLALIFTIFSRTTLILAVLGLFGLSSFTIEQRQKEIGIRKILGSSIGGISVLLSKRFLLPVLISVLIAIPSALVIMTVWLHNFANKATISGWLLVGPSLLAFIISILTISFHTIKAASRNPMVSLKAN
jgi:putative ABC transport system permease protein